MSDSQKKIEENNNSDEEIQQKQRTQSTFMAREQLQNDQFENQSKDDLRMSQRKSVQIQQNLQQSVVGGDIEVKVVDSIKMDNITFVGEKEFKKDPKCKVCSNIFGNLAYRQHHCRLCAQSVCDYCSMKKVNETRVCDVCFLKLKNYSGEKRKKKLLKTIKSYIQTISQNVIVGKKEVEKLEQKIKEEEKLLNESSKKLKDDRSKLQADLQKCEDEKAKKQESIESFDTEYKPKQDKIKELKDELNKYENELKIIDTEIAFKKQSAQGKQNHWDLLIKTKKDQENSDDFNKLPNYQRAKKYGEHLSEAILHLDKQFPPEQYFENLEKQQQQQQQQLQTQTVEQQEDNSINYKVSYQEEYEKSILGKERSDSIVRTHNVRPKGDKFMCYV